MTKELVIVVGPNGSGKSSSLFETHINDNLMFINPDDIAREYFSDVIDEVQRNLLAWQACNNQRDMLLLTGASFGFETVGSHPSKIEFIQRAKDLGYKVTLLFVATEDPEINIARIKQRIKQGGHSVPDEKVRNRYYRTLGLLKDYFETADEAYIWDNSLDAQDESCSAIRELVRKTSSGIEVVPDAKDVYWVQNYLLNKLKDCK